MVTTCTTFWSFLSPRWPLPAHGDNMHHFLVIFVAAVSLDSPCWQHAPHFGHFCHRDVFYQPMVTQCTTFWSFLSPRCPLPTHADIMHHFLVIFVTALFFTIPRWQHAPLFGHFCHRGVLQQPMVTTCNTFWSFLSPRCPLPAHGNNMHHFLVIFVIVVSFTIPWWQHAPLFGHFCHHGVFYQPMLTTCTNFWSFLSPRCPLPVHGDNMHHFLVIFVPAVPFTSPWWKHALPFGHFCHHGVLYQPMVSTCTTLWSFLSPRCPLPTHGDNMHHYLVIFVASVSSSSPWWQHAPLFGHFCHHGVLYQPMVTTCTTFWFFCHCGVFYHPMVTTCTTFCHFCHHAVF